MKSPLLIGLTAAVLLTGSALAMLNNACKRSYIARSKHCAWCRFEVLLDAAGGGRHRSQILAGADHIPGSKALLT